MMAAPARFGNPVTIREDARDVVQAAFASMVILGFVAFKVLL